MLAHALPGQIQFLPGRRPGLFNESMQQHYLLLPVDVEKNPSVALAVDGYSQLVQPSTHLLVQQPMYLMRYIDASKSFHGPLSGLHCIERDAFQHLIAGY